MAIDTAAKRLATLDYGNVWTEAVPLPDGTVDEYDRSHLLWSYFIVSILLPTPSSRVYIAAVESRLLAIGAETRVSVVDGETRIYIPEGD